MEEEHPCRPDRATDGLLCSMHAYPYDGGHILDGRPVCDWWGWMFMHDDAWDGCPGCPQ